MPDISPERLLEAREQTRQILAKSGYKGKEDKQGKTQSAIELEGKGYESWLKTLGPRSFTKPFASFHHRFWQWYWPARLKLLRGEKLSPDELTALLIWGRGLGKCLAIDTEILMADGTVKPIQEIKRGDRVIAIEPASGKSVIDKVSHVWASGAKSCLELRTRTGRKLLLTPEHRLWAFDGWKECSSLRVGDRIALPRRTRPEEKATHRDEEVRLLAYMLAEGCTVASKRASGGNSIACYSSFTNIDKAIVDDFAACALSLGFSTRKIGKTISYRLRGAQAWLREQELSGKASWEKSMPAWVFHAPEKQRWMLLAAFVDTDGCVEKAQISIALASHALVKDLQRLFLSVGVVSSCKYKANDKRGAWVLLLDKEGVKLCGLKLPLLLKGERLIRLLATPRYSLLDVYPFTIFRGLPFRTNRHLRRYGLKVGNPYDVTRVKLRRAMQYASMPQWEWLEAAEVFWDEIVSITEAGETETYDIETAYYHNFLANGIVSHNSTHVEWACVAEGALNEGSTDEPGFVGYVCLTEALARGHIKSIRNRLDSPEIAKYYPGLSNPLVDKHGYQTAWRQDFLATSSHWGIIPIGLEEGVRGGRLFDLRFTMFVFDDIDSRKVSSAVVKKTLDTIAYEILPAGTPQTLKLVPQNLVREDGALAQIFSRESDVLSRRTVIGTEDGQPLPAFDEVELELDETRPGAYKIKSAVPVWEGFDLDAAEVFLSDSGRAGFFAEFQNRFDVDRSDFILPNWRDEVHVITRSEFQRKYGTRKIPFYWAKRWFNDWARTKTAKHANVAGCLSVSAQNTELPGITFLSDCLTFEPNTEADDVALRILKTISPTVTIGAKVKTWEEVLSDSFTRTNISSYTQSVTDMITATRDSRSKVIPPLVRKILWAQKLNCFRGSHEQNNNALKVYREVYGLPFSPCDPGADGGIELLNHLMNVDPTHEHPFKEDELLEDGTYKLGFTRFFVVVDDNMALGPQGHNPAAMNDSDLARYQFRWWKSAPVLDNASGEVERGPEKRLDDFGNGLMFCVHDGLPQATPLNYGESLEAAEPQLAALNQKIREGTFLTPQEEMKAHVLSGMARKKIAGAGVRRFGEDGELLREY